MNETTYRLVSEVFALLGVKNFLDLSNAYTQEDQKLMKSREWDARDPTLIINQVKTILEQIDSTQLNELDRQWYAEILWFWYHHAVSYAIWGAKDRKLAQSYADKALELQSNDHPNRLTKLLWFLVHDKVDEAKKWMAEIPVGTDEVEHANGLELIREYEQGEFF